MSAPQFPPRLEGGFSDGLEQNAYFCGLVHGFSQANGLRLSTMTGAGEWFIIVGDGNDGPQSASISRNRMLTYQDVRAAVLGQLDALPYWTKTREIGDLPDDAEIWRDDDSAEPTP